MARWGEGGGGFCVIFVLFCFCFCDMFTVAAVISAVISLDWRSAYQK